MKLVVLFILFLGILVVVQGYYMKQLNDVKGEKTVTKYVPLSVFEGRMNGSEMIDYQFKSQFQKITSN